MTTENNDRKFVYFFEQTQNGVTWQSRPYATQGPAKRAVTKYQKLNPDLKDQVKAVEYELVPTGRVL